MTYRSDDGTQEEVIWNSRDGVTPFVITSRSGKEMSHVDWRSDQCIPNYKPQVGERVFVDLTYEKALEYAQRNLAKYASMGWDMTDAPSPENLAEDYMKPKGAPDLVEVTQEIVDLIKAMHVLNGGD